MNRGLLNGLFHAMGTSRLWAGTVCDSCSEAAWDVTVGPIGGADPESVAESDLVICWGADLFATNVHFWAKVEEARKRGVPARGDRSAPHAIGADADLASSRSHRHRCRVGARHHACARARRVCDRDYIAQYTLGFDQVEREILPRFTPRPRRRITGIPPRDVERLAAMYGARGSVHPAGMGHVALHLWRSSAAYRRAAARRDRCLWTLWWRCAAGDCCILRTELQRDAQAVRSGDHANR